MKGTDWKAIVCELCFEGATYSGSDYFSCELKFSRVSGTDFTGSPDYEKTESVRDYLGLCRWTMQGDRTGLGGERRRDGFYGHGQFCGASRSGVDLSGERMIEAGRYLLGWESRYRENCLDYGTPSESADLILRVARSSRACWLGVPAWWEGARKIQGGKIVSLKDSGGVRHAVGEAFARWEVVCLRRFGMEVPGRLEWCA